MHQQNLIKRIKEKFIRTILSKTSKNCINCSRTHSQFDKKLKDIAPKLNLNSDKNTLERKKTSLGSMGIFTI